MEKIDNYHSKIFRFWSVPRETAIGASLIEDFLQNSKLFGIENAACGGRS